MKLPLSLLKSFLDISEPLSEIAEILTSLGAEVDAIHQVAPPFTGVVVGEVLSAEPHPNAERLKLAQVSDGENVYQIVCGASNCRKGLKVAFAKIGAKLTGAHGEIFSIKAAKLRGIESFGMLCSEEELLLSQNHEGILELPSDLKLGEDLLNLLWDPVFELSLTPNLGHCLSARGVARELSAALKRPLKRKEHSPAFGNKPQTMKVTVEDPLLCPKYMGLTIEGVHIGESPFWLQRVLQAAGMRPINNSVDITNYILLKWGQPMHAFDADLLKGNQIQIQKAVKNSSILCLDEVERNVPAGSLLILDENGPVAIAGVIGGAKSAVSEQTKRVFLEAAFFDPESVRKTAKSLGLRTESALRFEKGIDPEATRAALQEAAALFLSLCGGHLPSPPIDTQSASFAAKKISCRAERVEKILGVKLSLHEIEEMWQRLGFKTELHKDVSWTVSVPFYRFDVNEEIDLIEEVARIYGYNAIDKKAPLYASSKIPHDPQFLFERNLRDRFKALGLQEIVTPDLISPKLAELAIETKLPHVRYLEVLHAKSEEYSILRPSLLPGFLQVVRFNIDQKNLSFAGFEIGRIHFAEDEENRELPIAGIFLTGKSSPHHWDQKPADIDFYDLKGMLEDLFASMHISEVSYKASVHPSFHPGRQASIYLKDLAIGSFGEVHPRLLEMIDIKQRVFYAELYLEPLLEQANKRLLMQPLPSFPASERDWTISLPKGASAQPIFDAIQAFSSPLLEKSELIDVFAADTQNVTLRFTYRDLLKTISFEEVEAEHQRLMQIVLASLQ